MSVSLNPLRASIVVPLWNEADNIDGLVAMLESCQIIGCGGEAVLVENGSSDDTRARLMAHAARYSWIRPLYLAQNQNYGGGLLAGAAAATGDIVCFIPGDLQYDGDDLDKIVGRAMERASRGERRVLVKGNRLSRLDSASMRFVSSVYTLIANGILGLKVEDVNGLPKAFDRSLLNALPTLRMKTFVLDAQLIHVARLSGWSVEEMDVTFHARRAGVSSWSGKRVQTYLRSLRQLWQVRRAGAVKFGA